MVTVNKDHHGPNGTTLLQKGHTRRRQSRATPRRRQKRQQTLALLIATILVVGLYRFLFVEDLDDENNSGHHHRHRNGEIVSPASVFKQTMQELQKTKEQRRQEQDAKFEELRQRRKQHNERMRNQPPVDDQKTSQDDKNKQKSLFQRAFDGFKQSPRWKELDRQLQEWDESIVANKLLEGIRWVRPDLLVGYDGETMGEAGLRGGGRQRRGRGNTDNSLKFFKAADRASENLVWKQEVEKLGKGKLEEGPKVNFVTHDYEYPEKLSEPPPQLGDYPPLETLGEIMNRWPQDDIDHPPTPFKEVLIHFDYTKEEDVRAAEKFRDAKLPFKMTNVPEVVAAGELWTDEYVSSMFDKHKRSGNNKIPRASGACQESISNFFAFYTPQQWDVEQMGLPPTRNNDLTFQEWAEHARYADATQLDTERPHFYYQSGVDREERKRPYDQWTFISRDLPSFSSPTKTFFVFSPEDQKGIQCRFGERGVTAATHFDSGRNMVAMMQGAKRYILSPPNQCRKLGIVTTRGNPIFRHSLLNFGHIPYLNSTDPAHQGMPKEERAWLEEQSQHALAIDTVVKAGEVLYIPSHWFHYITSLQKSAQCNVRSGIDVEGDEFFGGKSDVSEKCVL